MSINRRTFMVSSGLAAAAAFVPRFSSEESASISLEPFQWKTSDLIFTFAMKDGRLRQQRMVPVGSEAPLSGDSSGVEVALQCTGENSPDQGMKSGVGEPGTRLLFAGHREGTSHGSNRLICMHTDPILHLNVESVYDAFDGVPVVRRYSRVTNAADYRHQARPWKRLTCQD